MTNKEYIQREFPDFNEELYNSINDKMQVDDEFYRRPALYTIYSKLHKLMTTDIEEVKVYNLEQIKTTFKTFSLSNGVREYTKVFSQELPY